MPELPEVETVCRTLSPVLVGKTFAGFELSWHRTLAYPEAPEFSSAIIGKTISGIGRRAKLILIHLEGGGTVSVHLRMTGELLYIAVGGRVSPERSAYLRAEFLFTDGSELLFYDTRKFGRIAFVDDHQLKRLDEAYGVEPLGPDFTPEWLYRNLRARKRQIKPLLLDQSFIAGLGNIYVDESLYLAGIHPTRSSAAISRQQAQRLHDAIVESLTGALERRGTTLRDYRSGFGDSGENRGRLLVYGSRPGTPCPRCGAPLARLLVGQRGSIFCPSCQPAPRRRRTRNR